MHSRAVGWPSTHTQSRCLRTYQCHCIYLDTHTHIYAHTNRGCSECICKSAIHQINRWLKKRAISLQHSGDNVLMKCNWICAINLNWIALEWTLSTKACTQTRAHAAFDLRRWVSVGNRPARLACSHYFNPSSLWLKRILPLLPEAWNSSQRKRETHICIILDLRASNVYPACSHMQPWYMRYAGKPVHRSGTQGCIFSHPCLSSTQEILKVRVSGHSVQILVIPSGRSLSPRDPTFQRPRF